MSRSRWQAPTRNLLKAPESGPWAAVIAHDACFAAQFVRHDVDRYLALVSVSCRALFDRHTIPGAKPEELTALKVPALILPGHTDFHATSCARYLEECIPGAKYWDVHLESQPPDRIRDRILAFLSAHAGAGVCEGEGRDMERRERLPRW